MAKFYTHNESEGGLPEHVVLFSSWVLEGQEHWTAKLWESDKQ